MFVEQLLPTALERLVTIREDAPLIEAARLLRAPTVNLVVVCEANGAMAGVVTKTDVISQISHCEGCSCTTAASLVMTRNVVSCQPGDLLADLWSVMKQRALKHVPIVDQGGQPIGLLNARNVVEALLGEVQYEEALLRDYVCCVGYH